MATALDRYRARRDFTKTPEPRGPSRPRKRAQAANGPGSLRYVVQKHWARRLHYDFRLEVDGTMKSWAVPKGPSLDPTERRMAVPVEDHPLDYAGFEGRIPAGRYGAGEVIVWDKGWWQPDGDPAEALAAGKLGFTLHGHKLSGRWALIRTRGSFGGRSSRQPGWLLVEERDASAAAPGDPPVVEARPESVGRLADAPYVSRRDTGWIKLKCGLRQEFVIVGFTDVAGGGSGVGALLVAVHDDAGRLRYAGRVGTGFDAATRRALAARLGAIATAASPLPRTTGLPRVTHPDRVIDRSTGTTKIALVRFMARIAALAMPHLQDRPVSFIRAPDGVDGPTFFQRHAERGAIDGIRLLDPRLDEGHAPLMVVARPEALAAAAQMNVFEWHTWNARRDRLDRPDRMTFDLDPGAGVAWPIVQEAAELVRVLLDELGLPAFLKTSGGKGLHVVVPIRRGPDWDAVKDFAGRIARHLTRTLPDRFVATSGARNRIGRIYIDFLRNHRGATTVAAWSVRARPGLGVSVPVRWRELASLTSAAHWTLATIDARLATGNDPWAGYAEAAASIAAASERLG